MARLTTPTRITFALFVVAIGAGIAMLVVPRLGGEGPADPANADAVAQGKALYAEYCAECHGADLAGEANWQQPKADGSLPAPPHDETGHTWHHPDSALFAYTRHGGAALAGDGFKSAMPGFADRMTDAEIWSVIAYIKSTWPERERAYQARITQQAGAAQ